MAKYLDYKGLEKVVENIKTLCGDYLPLTGGELTGDIKIVDGKTLKVENIGENTTYSKIEPEGIFIHNSDAGELDITIKGSNVDFGDNNVNTYKLITDTLEIDGKEVSHIEDEIDEDDSENENSLATIDAIVEYVNSKVGAAFKPEVVNVLPSVGKENTFYFVPKLELKVEDKDASESSYVYPLSTSSPYITSGFVNIEAHVNIPTLASSWNIMHFTTASNANTQAGLRIINNSTGQVGLGNSTSDAAAVTVTGLKAGDNILTLSYDFDTKKATMGVNGNKAERDLTLSEIRSLQFSNRSATTYKINKVYVAMSGAAATGPNIYDEYIYIGGRWEQIGSTEVTFGLATKDKDGLMYHLDKKFLDALNENVEYVGDDSNNIEIKDGSNYLRLTNSSGNTFLHSIDELYLTGMKVNLDTSEVNIGTSSVDTYVYGSNDFVFSTDSGHSIIMDSPLEADEGFEAELRTSGSTYDTTSQMKLTSGGFTISGDSVRKSDGVEYLNQIKTSNSKMTIDAEDMSINVNKTFDVNVKNNDITLDSNDGHIYVQPSGVDIKGNSKVNIKSGGELGISGTTTRISADTYIETSGTSIKVRNSEVNIGCVNTSDSEPDTSNINMLAYQQQNLSKNQTIIANSSNNAASPKTTKVAIKEDDVVIGLERSNSNNISSLDSDIDVGFKIGSDSEIKAYGSIKVYDEIIGPNNQGNIEFVSDDAVYVNATGYARISANNYSSYIDVYDENDPDTGYNPSITLKTPGKAYYNTKEIATVDQIPSVSDKVTKTGDTMTGALTVSNTAMPLAQGKVTGLTAGTSKLFKDALAISNPATPNDLGWIRVLGTGETDTVMEIATGDDAGAGESIVFRGYNTSNTVGYQVDVPKATGTIALQNGSYPNMSVGSATSANDPNAAHRLNGTVTATTDWNTLTAFGSYKVQMSAWGNATTYHSPNAIKSDLYSFGLLEVLGDTASDGEKRLLQRYYPHKETKDYYFRWHNNSDINAGWGSWVAADLSNTWRPLGTGATDACAGNDARLSNARPANGGTAASLYQLVADNDYIRVQGGSTGSNAGFLEIATADDGNEPIYVRQYTGVFTNPVRTATLLDNSGNTSFPGSLTANSLAAKTIYTPILISDTTEDHWSHIYLNNGSNKASIKLTASGDENNAEVILQGAASSAPAEIQINNNTVMSFNNDREYGIGYGSHYDTDELETHSGLLLGDLSSDTGNGSYTILAQDAKALYNLEVYGALYKNRVEDDEWNTYSVLDGLYGYSHETSRTDGKVLYDYIKFGNGLMIISIVKRLSQYGGFGYTRFPVSFKDDLYSVQAQMTSVPAGSRTAVTFGHPYISGKDANGVTVGLDGNGTNIYNENLHSGPDNLLSIIAIGRWK